MLDNFGLMEFLFLALLALLFFGPERLPQIGARLGRWLRTLTQYSKSFMNQWSEEALAIHDAVAEVRGIRDEIRAAQAEIAGSLQTARSDIDQTISEARDQIKQAQPSARAFLEGEPGTRPTSPAGSGQRDAPDGNEIARAKTQEIVDGLMAKRQAAPASEGKVRTKEERDEQSGAVSAITSSTESEEKELPATALGEEVTPTTVPQDKVDLAVAAQAEKKETESAFDRTQAVLNKLLGKETPPAEEELASTVAQAEAEAQPAAAEAAQETKAPSLEEDSGGDPTGKTPGPLLGVTIAETDEKAPIKTATAFERTQRVLDKLLGREVPPEEEEVAPASAPETATLPEGSTTFDIDARTPELGPGPTGDSSDVEKLGVEVAMLRSEIRALRRELHALEDEVKEREGLQPASETTATVSVEEAA